MIIHKVLLEETMIIHKVLLEELSSLITDEYESLVKSAVSYANKNEPLDRVEFKSHKYCHNKLKSFKEFYAKTLEKELVEASKRIEASKSVESSKGVDEENKSVEQESSAKKIEESILSKKKEIMAESKKAKAAPKMTSTSEGPISPIVDKVPEKKAPAKRGRPKKK
tara:strand:+ start:219 stop:719 length:501 start_codon:yes stop_codon:yes gene_type:complete